MKRLRLFFAKLRCFFRGHKGTWELYSYTTGIGNRYTIPYIEVCYCSSCDEFCLRFNESDPTYRRELLNRKVFELLK